MKPIVILSTDTTPDYLFLLPITAKTWELQGFQVHAVVCGNYKNHMFYIKYMPEDSIINNPLDNINCINPALYSQCVRLYEPTYNDECYDEEDYIILGDVDMLLGSNFLYRDFHKVNVFGHDLTGFEHVPMCYVGATRKQWEEIMSVPKDEWMGMSYDIDRHCDLSTKERAWVCDQDILTAKLKSYGYDKINFINRGTDPENSNLPLGRCDRYNNMKLPKGPIHDVHLMRNPMSKENTAKIIEIASLLYPKEDWSWINEYRDEFVNSLV